MDTKTLISDAKARFNHNAAKSYLKEKYETRLIVAEQGGLWRANLQTINFLNNSQSETVILVDSFENPVEVIPITINFASLLILFWYIFSA
jgi:hypothetical protein